MIRRRGIANRDKSVTTKLTSDEKQGLLRLCKVYECSQQDLVQSLIGRELWRLETFGKSLKPGQLDSNDDRVIEGYCMLISNIFGVSRRMIFDQVVPHLSTVKVGERLLEELQSIFPRGAFILRRRYGLDGDPRMTLEEVGTEDNITRQRVRQLEGKALRILRHPRNRRILRQTLVINTMFTNRETCRNCLHRNEYSKCVKLAKTLKMGSLVPTVPDDFFCENYENWQEIIK